MKTNSLIKTSILLYLQIAVRLLKMTAAIFLVFLIGINFSAAAFTEREKTERFITGHFNPVPEKKYLWIQGPLKKQTQEVLEHSPQQLRVPYWQAKNKTLWILEEIGKEKPITVGVTIENNKIIAVEILAFREKRGWEVQNPSFTNQFIKLFLKNTEKATLSDSIDGLSGATLSVRAVTKVSKLALLYHRHLYTLRN